MAGLASVSAALRYRGDASTIRSDRAYRTAGPRLCQAAQNSHSGVLANGKRARRRGLGPRREPAYRAGAASSNVYGTYPSLVEGQVPGN